MKRMLSLLLAAALLAGFLVGGATYVSAETEENVTESVPEETGLRISDECIEMIKEYEGFRKYPYSDYTQYSIGYGSRCPADMLDYYREHGITEEEAEVLLRNHLEAYERDVLTYAEKYDLELNQQRFDALISFSYNCGSAWMFKATSELHRAIIAEAPEQELIHRFALWCTAGGSVLNGLVRRRLCETNLYVNGVYSTTRPENYCYVVYNANGGEVDVRVQGYMTDYPVDFVATATYEGHTFLGWFTEKVGGQQVTALNADSDAKTLYAQWEAIPGYEGEEETPEQKPEETPEQKPEETPEQKPEETPEQKPEQAEPIATVQVTADGVNYRKGPGTNYTVLGQKNTGDKLEIYETQDANGYSWGRFADGWLALSYTNYDEVTKPEEAPEETPEEKPEELPEETPEETPEEKPEETPEQKPEEPKKLMGTIKVNQFLNIRENAGTGYALVGQYSPNDRVEILEQKAVGATMWGRTDRGWISMDYVELDKEEQPEEKPEEPEQTPEQPEQKPEQTPEETPDDSQKTVTGVVNSNDFLRIRSGPGTSYDMVGYLYSGERVTITELKDNGSMTWGKIDRGWVSMTYITLDSEASEPEQKPAVGETGTVNVTEFLRVRSGPGTSYAISGFLYGGDKVTITEKKTVGATVWGKIEQGWISLDYVVMDSDASKPEQKPEEKPEQKPEEKPEQKPETVTGIVTSNDFLRVRSGPGTDYAQVGFVYAGDKLTITEIQTVGTAKWGRITQGWVSMDYVKVVEEVEKPQSVTKTVTADCLNVRSGAGTGYSIVGYLYEGAKVEVFETKTVNGVTWGKIATGWISLEYTK